MLIDKDKVYVPDEFTKGDIEDIMEKTLTDEEFQKVKTYLEKDDYIGEQLWLVVTESLLDYVSGEGEE